MSALIGTHASIYQRHNQLYKISMQNTIDKLKLMSEENSDKIKIPQPLDLYDVIKITNKLPLISMDIYLLEFYKCYDGISISDLCIYSLKKNNLRMDINTGIDLLWQSNKDLAGYFLPFANNSTGDYFGLLSYYKNIDGSYPIGHFNNNLNNKVYYTSSNFDIFLSSILSLKDFSDFSKIEDLNAGGESLDILMLKHPSMLNDEMLLRR